MKLFKKLKKKRLKFSYYKLSITGGREINQDECIVLKLGEKSFFMAIADGMGGTANGYIASNLAANIAYDILEKNFKDGEDIKTDELKNILKSVYIKIQEVIKEQTAKNPALSSMGTTLTSLLISKGKYVWGNIGDSKIFQFKNKNLAQLTEDHTYINDFEKESKNTITTEMKNSYGHLLTKCLDGGDDKPDIFPLDKDYEELKKNDLFLLCSDGLILDKTPGNAKYFIKIFRPFFKSNRLEKAGKLLINNSLKEGSTDNITLILYLNLEKKMN